MTKSRTPRPTQFSKESTKEFIRDSESGFFINPSFPSYYAGDYPSTQRCLQQWRAACSLLSPRQTVSPLTSLSFRPLRQAQDRLREKIFLRSLTFVRDDNAASGHYDTVSDAGDLRGGSCR